MAGAAPVIDQHVEREIAPLILAERVGAFLPRGVHKVARIRAALAQRHAMGPTAREVRVMHAPALAALVNEVQRLALAFCRGGMP